MILTVPVLNIIQYPYHNIICITFIKKLKFLSKINVLQLRLNALWTQLIIINFSIIPENINNIILTFKDFSCFLLIFCNKLSVLKGCYSQSYSGVRIVIRRSYRNSMINLIIFRYFA